jgi:hypothetical protein
MMPGKWIPVRSGYIATGKRSVESQSRFDPPGLPDGTPTPGSDQGWPLHIFRGWLAVLIVLIALHNQMNNHE